MNDIELSKYTRWLLYMALGIYIIHIIYAIISFRLLYADGSYYFVSILAKYSFMQWGARKFAQIASQIPLVAALKLGIKDISVLGYIYGTSLFISFPISLIICYWAAKEEIRYLVFPLLSLVAGFMNTEFFIISEHNFLLYLFWALLFLMLFRKGLISSILIVLLAFPTLLSYQSMLFFGPILAIIAIWRGLRIRSQRFMQFFWYILALWFLAGAIIALQTTLTPEDPSNFQNFYRSTLFFMGHGSFHYPGILSLLILFMITILLWKPEGLERFWFWIIAAISVACVIVALLPSVSPTTLALNLQYRARVLNVYLPILLACCLLAIHGKWFTVGPAVWHKAYLLLALLGISQGLWHLSATYQWNKYLLIFRQEIHRNCGLIPFEQSVLSALDKAPHHISRSMNWGWTMPVMSTILGAQNGQIRTIIDNSPAPGYWEPFDPAVPDQLPDLSYYGVNYDLYIHALTHPELTCQGIEELQEIHERNTL